MPTSASTDTHALPPRAQGRYDAVVVGSGFGGAVAALRLAQRGFRVAVLERGRLWGREDFPRPGAPRDRWWWSENTHGLFEIVRSRRLSLLTASGVGGGSLIYTNIQMRAPEETFATGSPHPEASGQGWPAGFTRAALDPYYDRVFAMLTPSPLPEPLPKTSRLREAAQRLGLEGRFSLPDLAIYWGEPGAPRPSERGEQIINRFGASQSACIGCGLCMFGCHVHAKNTLDLNYLKLAAQHGAQIFPLHEVETFEPVGRGYLVRFRHHVHPTGVDSIAAVRVLVLAAGTLGTNRILLRAKHFYRTLPNLSPRLGYGFSDNGDFFGALLGAGDVQPALGPTLTAMLDFHHDAGFTLFEGGVPDFLAPRLNHWLTPLLAFWRLRARMRSWFGGTGVSPVAAPGSQSKRSEDPASFAGPARLSRAQSRGAFDSLLPLLMMGLDAANGRLVVDPKGELQILWEHTQSAALFRRMTHQIRDLGRALGAWGVESPAWRFRRRLFGVHPLGGCALAASPEHGVVNEAGEVFGYPNLYIADGSIVPTALGVPPSMTIAALAEHILEGIV
ncbi:MAG: GMC oxidoreductase [Terriglobia bacterium]